jgi:hypothetical protein
VLCLTGPHDEVICWGEEVCGTGETLGGSAVAERLRYANLYLGWQNILLILFTPELRAHTSACH